jgi:Uma2 family endonuclease
MATQTTKTGSGLVPYRLTVQQFLKMKAANVFDEDRVELLGGTLYPLTADAPHAFSVSGLGELIRRRLPTDWTVWEDKGVHLDRFWLPRPNIAVLKVPLMTFACRLPQPQDIALLVEIADTTYPRDSGIKLRQYAHARVPEYWIVHLEHRQVEVYRDPHGRGGKAKYRSVEIYRDDVEIPIVLDGQDLGRLAVREFLP